MRAVAVRTFGGPEVLEVVELPDPEPGPGEVRVRVHAATVNPTDISFRSGRSAEALAAFPPPYVPGMELAGTVDALGPGSSWEVGQRVLGIAQPSRNGRGAQSELVVLPNDSIALIPGGASFEAAATLPMNGLTVRRGLDLLALPAGATIVVTGAAGGVGGYAVELAKADGLKVVAIAGADDEVLVRSFGADRFVARGPGAIDAARELAEGGAAGLFDAAVIGPPALAAVRDGGKVAVVRAVEAGNERGIEVHHVRVGDYATNRPALEALAALVLAGRLTLRVAETYPPEQAAIAQQRLAAGGTRGRLVIIF
ncbi:MAG TPA: NADP-dependent oxidoreductase [Acidimicrobiales bacterium]|nr:NADP-dependent oxidoreductase [Acidimicrobiales bacterium]